MSLEDPPEADELTARAICELLLLKAKLTELPPTSCGKLCGSVP